MRTVGFTEHLPFIGSLRDKTAILSLYYVSKNVINCTVMCKVYSGYKFSERLDDDDDVYLFNRHSINHSR